MTPIRAFAAIGPRTACTALLLAITSAPASAQTFQGRVTGQGDGEPVPTDQWPRLDRFREHNIDLPLGETDAGSARELAELVRQALDIGKGVVRVVETGREGWGRETPYSTQRACPGCGRAFEEPDPRLFSYNSKHGWCPSCFGTGRRFPGFDARQTGEEGAWLEAGGEESAACPECGGRRLRPEALAVTFRDRSIADCAALSVEEAADFLAGLTLSGREDAIARDLITEMTGRLGFLSQVGLGYLGLDRAAPTLSGGEAQRIRLAAQLGSSLQGVCYVLDEPTIGLHPRDNRMLLDTRKWISKVLTCRVVRILAWNCFEDAGR